MEREEWSTKMSCSPDALRRAGPAGRIGRAVASNPYLDVTSAELLASVEGFVSVETSILLPSERASILSQVAMPESAGKRRHLAHI